MDTRTAMEDVPMPLNAAGAMAYIHSAQDKTLLLQADPPVCNRCKQTITRENFGQAYLEACAEGQLN